MRPKVGSAYGGLADSIAGEMPMANIYVVDPFLPSYDEHDLHSDTLAQLAKQLGMDHTACTHPCTHMRAGGTRTGARILTHPQTHQCTHMHAGACMPACTLVHACLHAHRRFLATGR